MKLKTLLGISRRNIFRNRRRSLLSAAAIAISTLSVLFFQAYVAGIKTDMGTQIQNFVTGEVRIQHKDREKNELLSPLSLSVPGVNALLADLDRDARVASSVARITFTGAYLEEEDQKPLVGWGVDFPREAAFAKLDTLLTAGTFPAPGAREVVLGAALAGDLGLGVGSDISILYRTARMSTNYITLKVSGLISLPMGALNRQIFLVDRQLLAPKLFLEDQATQVLVKTRDGDAAALEGRLQKNLAGDLDIRSWDKVDTLYSLMGLAEIAYDFIGIFFYLLGSTVIISTTMMVIFERIREIGTIGALGMTDREILLLFFLEALQIAAAGALAGLVLGLAAILPFSYFGIDLRSVMDKIDMGISGMIYPMVTLRSLITVPLAAVAVSSLAALIPARRSTKIPPVTALRTYS